MVETFNEVMNEIVDYCYGAIITTDDCVDMDDTETFAVIKGIASILDFKYDVLKQAVYEDHTAIDMLRAEIEYRHRPDKKEVYELICEALGVNFMATKEDLKQLIDEL
ncbi:MAG: hypothetical protein LIO79_07690 [Rikenellaceae bacterium]|nr:hypothetical protein [Rikenellaceae bacterium]